ncbi:hypothetical protein [Halobellus salinus]|nr:hypothetical protein [Halobellus salinus]SMP12666.1 hypothetical protein SAMN06265347_10496 [Halobellus salinus]
MAAAVVDTGVLIGVADTDGKYHGVGMTIVHGIDHGQLLTSNCRTRVNPV